MKKFVLAVLFVLGCVVSVQAAPFPATDEKLPVDVVADRMVYETDKNTVTFQGNVEAVRGEFTMWSERLILYLKASKEEEKKAASEAGTAMAGSELERIVAQGNVRFKNGTQTGSSEKATYLADQGLLVLEGEPVLHDGENSIRGKVIRYYTKENRSVVEGGPKQRVHAVFSSGDKEKRP
ncbi:lipopolysaccharide transport periplasmic protein LptA [uncultured Mailhella sp.]|uniref:lipopolysaccharide transport periplasmic protein LptA n=1 Tax=uncultured Mailhella sp. TaxID=1981031 RepID=UPI0026175D37|nr:lipopolysaccharide transport periplasmic protein LptA [uncultured Mailhella sp.]